jgi:large subunit ribosomal protein L15
MNLPKVIQRPKKRVGRGIGSGKGGHTSGRGQKGQKSRGKIGVLFEGLKMKKSYLKRLPLMRGKGKFGPKRNKTDKFRTPKKVTKTTSK